MSVVAGRLGHARAATTLNIYSHFVEAGDQEAADDLGSLLDGKPDIHGQTMGKEGSGTSEAPPGDGA